MGTCALCGKEFERTISHPEYYRPVYIYVERGISKNHFLCPKCYEAKIKVCDCGCSSEEQTKAVSLLKRHVADKSDLLQNIVNSWIDGEENSYYSDVNDLVYYVSGPVESLFVFKNHLAILSSYYDWDDGAPWDYAMFYGHNVKGTAHKNYFIEIRRNKNSDLRTIKGEGLGNCSDTSCDMLLELNASFGGNGELLFKSDYKNHSFHFYYHQNKLMEEVYNYIQKRIENPDDDIAQGVENTKKVLEKQEGNKSESNVVAFSPADEIRKMKELFDWGILSQEEFDEAKKRLISKL